MWSYLGPYDEGQRGGDRELTAEKVEKEEVVCIHHGPEEVSAAKTKNKQSRSNKTFKVLIVINDDVWNQPFY